MSMTGNVTGAVYSFVSLMCGIFLIYYLRKFYALRHIMIVIKRRGNLVIVNSICAIILFLIGYPLIFYLYWEMDISPDQDTIIFFIGDILNDLIFTPTYLIGLTTTLLRYWLIYYDIQYSESCSNLEWKTLITSKSEEISREQWFINKKDKFGNMRFMGKRLFIFMIVCCVVITVSSLLYSPFNITTIPIYSFIFLLLIITIFILIVTIWRKMPYFNDNICLYQEVKLLLRSWISFMILYALVVVAEIMLGENIYFLCLAYFASMCGTFITPFLSTVWVLKQIENIQKLQDHPSNNPHSLREILQDEDIIILFMQHLIKEFSMESLLSLIEFKQYKSYLMQELHGHYMVGTIGRDIEMTLPLNLPHSAIVYTKWIKSTPKIATKRSTHENVASATFDKVASCSEKDEEDVYDATPVTPSSHQNNIDDIPSFSSVRDRSVQSIGHAGDDHVFDINDPLLEYRIKAYELYDKYIKIGSEFEINIGYAERHKFTNLMGNYYEWISPENEINETSLIILFDQAMIEMKKMLNNSKRRFKYQTLEK